MECIERDDIGRAFVATPINVVGEKPDWDAAFDAVTGSPVVLKLIFDNINVEKFKVCQNLSRPFHTRRESKCSMGIEVVAKVELRSGEKYLLFCFGLCFDVRRAGC